MIGARVVRITTHFAAQFAARILGRTSSISAPSACYCFATIPTVARLDFAMEELDRQILRICKKLRCRKEKEDLQ
nr:unnamed protein product [Haemonchus contortus]